MTEHIKPPRAQGELPIADHGVIGDLHTVALVGLDGSIDFFCAPRFDSPSVFAAILDAGAGGSFRVDPQLGEARRKQLYLPDTNVLLTRTLSATGVAEISDFMPIGESEEVRRVVRRVKSVRGDVRFQLCCAPRFGYGQVGHRTEAQDDAILFIPDDPRAAGFGCLRLRGSVPMRIVDGDAVAEFELGAEQTATFVLEADIDGQDSVPATHDYASESFKRTVNFWREWIGKSTYRGRWRDEVHRSALVLKMLFSQPHGSLVAAPTFGLPESPGGARNWDYRYTWVRDAAFTTYSLIRLGMTEETGNFINWIADRCAEAGPDAPLQPLYTIDGGTQVDERELDNLAGHGGARPVRVGNGAATQLQLDVFGALMDSVYLYDKYGQPMSYDLWMRLTRLVDWVCDNWRRPDCGIWEIRAGMRPHLSSRVLCWVAVDRALRLARHRSLPAPEARWTAARDDIYRSVFSEFWHEGKRSFVQTTESDALDASCLLMPLLRFISPEDPRWVATMAAVRRELVVDSLVNRYVVKDAQTDGFTDPEGTFTICSFWYAECLSRGGDLQQARFAFEKILSYANHLGLFSEEIGQSGEHLGNFPQAFTHLSLISAAYDIDRRLDGAGFGA
ncbi:glycoside hydrolase family 15 protein [Longimicrobium terrae]|uniref:GH15 family glucan-1,4-alpha-glucosidase n=1 Tax=Longimicrobium terrae TaxID=1639882 RepID=A0A841GTK6_9BACT|nr:glycoside hydrolase family 15 protein [Longimicrobium terrae]MBB4635535.1 GH15 family glucan-1,4-alpha-glucosidase [Longimicrobium terrae]MBB6069929.1 GH15 family glucan-1,4-alpha-glucosidase [Longimicrobium terrae]NNC32842.1 glycoside hydrolase family 15 protein [Longimicrobium terrae]